MGEKTVLVGVYPFAKANLEPLRVLEAGGYRLVANPRGRKLTEKELLSLVGEIDGWVAGTEPITRAVLDAAPRLRVIGRVGVGLDSVDLEAARERGIVVAYTPEAPADSVAELTLGLLLDLAREAPRADRALRAGNWDRRTGFLLAGKTLGILGCGRIGRRVARLARAFDMTVLAHDVVTDVAWATATGVRYVGLDDLLATSDALTVHLPLTSETRGILGASELARMKRGALLLNTCRGEVLDETALERALESGHLGGAALDVFHEEPYKGPLTRFENVVLTAHMGSCSREGRLGMELGAARAVDDFFRGRPVADRVL